MSKVRDDRYKVRPEVLAVGGILLLIAYPKNPICTGIAIS